MGWIEDLLKEVPLSAVMKERVQLAAEKLALVTEQNETLKQRIKALERENEELRKNIPEVPSASLPRDTSRVLVYLFQTPDRDDCHVEAVAGALKLEDGVVKYHLDRLKEAGFARVRSALNGHVFWGLNPAGRRYVVENNLHST